MTFKAAGFLSPDAETWRHNFVVGNTKLFDLVSELNTLAHNLASSTVLINSEKTAAENIIAIKLFCRSLSNFQGAVLLAQHGMTIESRTLIRSCLESSFFLGALSNDEYELVERMLNDEYMNKKRFADGLRRQPNLLSTFDEEMLIGLEKIEQINGIPIATKINYEELSRKAGMHEMYNVYRSLSGDAAHPTLSSLHQYSYPSEHKNEGALLYPETDIERSKITVELACVIIVEACKAFNDIARNSTFRDDLTIVIQKSHCQN